MGETDKLVYSVNEAAELLSVGRTMVYDLIRDGRLRSLKVGHRRLIAREDLEAFVRSIRGAEAA